VLGVASWRRRGKRKHGSLVGFLPRCPVSQDRLDFRVGQKKDFSVHPDVVMAYWALSIFWHKLSRHCIWDKSGHSRNSVQLSSE
jgi:G:T-mismatch repair DNA endonuclease (very short patch repair protein)